MESTVFYDSVTLACHIVNTNADFYFFFFLNKIFSLFKVPTKDTSIDIGASFVSISVLNMAMPIKLHYNPTTHWELMMTTVLYKPKRGTLIYGAFEWGGIIAERNPNALLFHSFF